MVEWRVEGNTRDSCPYLPASAYMLIIVIYFQRNVAVHGYVNGQAGAEPDQRRSELSPLIQASRRGSSAAVDLLLSYKAGVNYRDGRRRTALMCAAEAGHAAVVASLLAAGADPLLEDSVGDTALTIGAWHGRADVVLALLPVSCIEHRELDEGMTALQLAIAKDCIAVVTSLLAAGANVNAVDAKGNSCLLTAMIHTSGSDVVQMLLEHGTQQAIDVNFRGDQGRTALHWAVGDPDSLRLLLNLSPDLDLVDGNGASALLLAIAHGRADSAAMLIDAGCDFRRVYSSLFCSHLCCAIVLITKPLQRAECRLQS